MAATRAIRLRTEIPGPRSRGILAREGRAVAAPLRVHAPLVAAEASGATVTDVDGNRLLDFAGGVGVATVGHGHPRVVEAIRHQAQRLLHTDYTVVPYEVYVRVGERLCALAPISGETRTAFFNAGTEAVENAVKVARLATGRPAVIAFDGAFHGRTLLALTMTARDHPYKTGMGPFAPEVHRAPFPCAYRGPEAGEALAALRRLLEEVGAERVAAIVFEPVQGEGGFRPAPQAFVEGLRALCDRHGIVLVADEVQTGFCRTGRMFAMERFGVEPDLVTVAKALAGGLPLSAVVGRAELMDAGHPGALGGTFVGNPVALAAADAVLDVLAEEALAERAAEIGAVVRRRMLAWRERWPEVGDVRGLGAMLAIELVRDPGAKTPAPDAATRVLEEALRRGLVLLRAGEHGNCIRLLCPLTIPDEELEEGLAVWEEALAAVLG